MVRVNLLEFYKEHGFKKTLQVWRVNKIQKILHKMGGLAMVLHTGPHISYSYNTFPYGCDDETRDELMKIFTRLIRCSMDEDKFIHDALLQGIADYLRPLTVDKKIFLDMLNKETTN